MGSISDRGIIAWFIVRLVMVLLAVVALGAWVSSEARALTIVNDRIFADGLENPGAGGGDPPPPVDNCVHPFVYPPGFDVDAVTWTQAFSAFLPTGPRAYYPNGVSWPKAIGAEKAHIKIVEFTANPKQSVLLYVDQVQPRPQDGYGRPRMARSMLVALSACGADVRPPNPLSLDPFEQPQCRIVENSGSIAWTTDPAQTGACLVEAGKTYHLVFAAVFPADGLDYGEHTCEDVQASAAGCDVGIVFQSSSAAQ